MISKLICFLTHIYIYIYVKKINVEDRNVEDNILKGRAWAHKTKAREISSEVGTKKRPLGFIDRKLIGKNQE